MLQCDSCGHYSANATTITIQVVPNDKKHLGPSESEPVDVCYSCWHGEEPAHPVA